MKPFVAKLGEHGKLEELTLRGIRHQATIEGFRAGLVKDGGESPCQFISSAFKVCLFDLPKIGR